jgi:hypothetical protein
MAVGTEAATVVGMAEAIMVAVMVAVMAVVTALDTLTVAGIMAGCGSQPAPGMAVRISGSSAMRRCAPQTSAMR